MCSGSCWEGFQLQNFAAVVAMHKEQSRGKEGITWSKQDVRMASIKSSSSFEEAFLCFRDDIKEQKQFWFKIFRFSPGSNWRRFWITGEPEAVTPTWQCSTARSEMLIRASGESQTSQTWCHSGISSNRKLLFQGHLGSRHKSAHHQHNNGNWNDALARC